MEKVLVLISILGIFTFLSMGLCLANSIEAKESELSSKIMNIIMVIGIAAFLIGMFGLLIFGIFFNN